MKTILSWYHPLSKRSENFDNFWRQVIFIAVLFLFSFLIWRLENTAYDTIRDYFIRTNRTYERKLATYGGMIFSFVGAILWFYSSWLVCWASKQQMKMQNIGRVPEIIMWLLLAFQAFFQVYGSTEFSPFYSFPIVLPIASIFTFYLLLSGFLKSKGINLNLGNRSKMVFKLLLVFSKKTQKVAGSISKEQH